MTRRAVDKASCLPAPTAARQTIVQFLAHDTCVPSSGGRQTLTPSPGRQVPNHPRHFWLAVCVVVLSPPIYQHGRGPFACTRYLFADLGTSFSGELVWSVVWQGQVACFHGHPDVAGAHTRLATREGPSPASSRPTGHMRFAKFYCFFSALAHAGLSPLPSLQGTVKHDRMEESPLPRGPRRTRRQEPPPLAPFPPRLPVPSVLG